MRTLPQFLSAFVCILMLQAPGFSALTVQAPDPNRHDRFNNSPSFIGNPHVWAGVGQNANSSWGTLISPSYMLTTAHGPIGGTVRFYQSNNANGAFIERTVVSGMQVGSTDLHLVRLNAPATGVDPFPIAITTTTGNFLGQTLYTFGLANSATPQANQRLGRNILDRVEPGFSNPSLNQGQTLGDVFLFDFDNPGGVGADESRAEGGDSGAPTFVIINGQPSLLGIHWFQFSEGSFGFPNIGTGDTLVSSYVTQINSSISALGGSDQVTTLSIIAIPEPSSLALTALIGSASWVAARRRRVRK